METCYTKDSWKYNRNIQLNSNLSYLKSLLEYDNKNTVDTPTTYIYLRIEEIERELVILEHGSELYIE